MPDSPIAKAVAAKSGDELLSFLMNYNYPEAPSHVEPTDPSEHYNDCSPGS